MSDTQTNKVAKIILSTASEIDQPAKLLVFSLAGRLGSGASFVGRNLRDELHSYKYEVVTIDVSTLIQLAVLGDPSDEDEPNGLQEGEEYLAKVDAEFEEKYPTAEQRTRTLQDTGNNMREEHGNDILAKLAVKMGIAEHLKSKEGVTKRQAFIIDSLKRPEEVAYLRKVFGSAYYAIGVVSTDIKRQERLHERKAYEEDTFQQLSEKDRKEQGAESGQRAVGTVLKSDYFFANNYSTKDQIKPEVARFLALVFNASMHTPRQDEFAMNVAYKSAARSACLSRQVGAAITAQDGQLIATGCNDVPKFGGGLYTAEDPDDHRCWARGGKCYNDEEKSQIIDELISNLKKASSDGGLFAQESGLALSKPDLETQLGKTLESVLQSSRIRQLIEFSRAVHAEMNAIMGVARAGKRGIAGGTMYCTTYPCHNCTKHIIDVGLVRLVYLEPYEKSLAKKLHSDSISDSGDSESKGKLIFQLYNGVAPSRYSEFFEKRQERKKSGKYVDRSDDKSQLSPLVHESAEEIWRRISKQISNANGEDSRDEEPN